MGSMKSLEEVLREALTNRVTEMNLYESESDEEEESWQ